jgi:hypothetical protein
VSEVAPETARFTYADLLSGQLTALVDLEWAGVTLRLAEKDEIAPIGDGGADVAYFAGLEWGGSMERMIDLFADQPDSASVDVTLHTYPRLVVPDLIANGYPLGGAKAKFRWWLRGTDRVMTVVDGRLRDPSWDVSPLPVVGTIEEAPFLDEGQWPPPQARVTSDTYANHDAAVSGEFYPQVIGAPGKSGGHLHSTPALIINTVARHALVSDGHVDAVGSALWIENTSTGNGVYATIVADHDALGRPVSTVDIFGSGIYAAGDSYWCRWHDAAGDPLYGLVDGGEAVKTAYQVMRWWLRRSTVRWDAGRVAVLSSMLSAYTIDCYAMADPDTRITPYHWVQDHLLPILPISAQFGPNGLYFVHWDYFADSTYSVLDVVEGLNADRVGAVDTTNLDDVRSTIVIGYQYDADKGEHNGRIVLSGDPVVLDTDDDATPDLFLKRTFQQYGTTKSITFETEVVEDAATAGRIAQWKARRYGAQSYRMAYAIQSPMIAAHFPGAVVKITDTSRGFDERIALIESLLYEARDHVEAVLVMPSMDSGHPA